MCKGVCVHTAMEMKCNEMKSFRMALRNLAATFTNP